MARIGIDARFFGSLGKGLGRYTQKLIENLERIDRENQYVVFLRKDNFDEYVPKNPNFHKVLADYRWYTFSEQLFFPRLLKKHDLDLVHFPHFNVPLLYRRKIVVTIHDLILLHFPTLRSTTLSPIWYWIKYLAYKWVIGSAVSRARHILTVSEFTKKDILEHYSKAKNKISVTYEACENGQEKERKNDSQIIRKYGIMKPYLLYVGNAYPHKNLERLIDAFGQLLQGNPELMLVLVGKEDYFYGRLKAYARAKGIASVIFAGFVPDDELGQFYADAQAYVFPSLYEGFGLPPLEAMKELVPVICSNHECMQEILGDAAYFVDAHSQNELANGLDEVLANEKLRQALVEKGKKQIKKYSWEKMAQDTLAAYVLAVKKQK
ncbi:MAG TPA: glycosyltransferase family 1 protein [Patescibacteria group bacterium]